MRLILASASPRRAELLQAAGFEFDVVPSHVDELFAPGETAEAHVARLARLKAEAVRVSHGTSSILGADTVVIVDGHVLGKPTDVEDARRMLRLLAGRTHTVMTGVCLLTPAGASTSRREEEVARTHVEFARLTEREIDWYVSSGEPLGKAGAYAIQGLASRFITRIDGSYSNVIGLPISVVCDLCKRSGLMVF